ncbi:MAG: hypothetical protein LBH64_03315 [Coriobacteriales bacterium]|jgi:hypothetical protein|nr:hypothetical protein [Coriobacteriales bacterium]
MLQSLDGDGAGAAAIIRVEPPEARVDERLAKAALACRPSLAQHSCKHQGFGYFGDKLLGTSLPHLVEHVAIDLLVEAARASKAARLPVAGNTSWLDRGRGLMRVRLVSAPAAAAGAGSAAPVASVAAQGCDEVAAEAACLALRRAVALVNDLLT